MSCWDEKYFVVVPYLSEIQYGFTRSRKISFKQRLVTPVFSRRKLGDLEELLILGENIVTTYSLYGDVVRLARGLLRDYEIIIVEVPEVWRSIATKMKYSINLFYIDNGFVDIQEIGLVPLTEKWRLHRDVVADTLGPKIFFNAETGCLFLLGEEMFIWAMLKELLQWVWRSRIRNGKPKVLYLPSPRMMSIFLGWLEDRDLMVSPRLTSSVTGVCC